MKRLLCIFLILALPAAVVSKEKTHIKTDGQDCSECHRGQMEAWQSGKHGLMNVKCVVCHGSPEEDFTARPGIYKCRGCHGEKVADAEKYLHKKQRTCFLCHDNHAVTLKESAAKRYGGFHRGGGSQ